MNHNAPCSLLRIRSVLTLLSVGMTLSLACAQPAAPTPTPSGPPYPMPTGTTGPTDPSKPYPMDTNPGPTSLTGKVLFWNKDVVPLKTLTIVNNTDQMIYPIMRDDNSKLVGSGTTGPKVGLYDPYDDPQKEYRGYIGYQDSGTCYFGLKPSQTITLRIPLVFWNAARIGIGTDGQYLTMTNPNPLRYRPESVRSITPAYTGSPAPSNAIQNGVVMWYRSGTSEAPNDDTEDQLAEWTIRDHNMLLKLSTIKDIPDSEVVTLINYDISNVDNLYLPLAMEVLDSWLLPQVTGTGIDPNKNGRWTPGSKPATNGWTGSVGDIASLQDKIRIFTSGTTVTTGTHPYMGTYFGGKGWPYYNMPNPTNDPKMPIKIPSGANIFAQSPLKKTPSSYIKGGDWATNIYMLSSGGTNATFVGIAGSAKVSEPPSKVIYLADSEPIEKIQFLKKDMIVQGNPPDKPPTPNPIDKDTLIDSVDIPGRSVTLNKPIINSTKACGYTFLRPVNDYAAEAMLKLWYGWANYYLKHWKDRKPEAPTSKITVTGSMAVRSATLNFSGSQPVVPGMAVKGPGLDDAMTEDGPHQGEAVILKVAADGKSAILSQVARNPGNGSYDILPPGDNPLIWMPKAATKDKPADPGYPPLSLDGFAPNEPWRDPYEFSQAVFLIMASMNQIGKPNNDSQCKFMQDIIGANMGYIFDQPAKDSVDGQAVSGMIRDMIKSVLRGVSDFTKYPDIIESGTIHKYWYPDPAKATANQTFNVFNLDPFVWFVHVKLGFTGYGFSVDDDTADIGAAGANNIILTVAGKNGLPNQNVWTIQAPYGAVAAQVQFSGTATDFAAEAIRNVTAATPIRVTTSAAHHLREGAKLVIDQVQDIAAANGTFTIKNVSMDAFDLYDAETGTKPITGTGTYKANTGRWYTPPVPYVETGKDLSAVYYRVDGDDVQGTYQGTPVTLITKSGTPIKVKGKNGEKIRVWRRGTPDSGRLLLNTLLIKDDGSNTPLEAGTYTFTFSAT